MAEHADAWHAVADYLRSAGSPPLFGLPGDDLAALVAVEDAGLRLVLCRDQRNAVFMATGYAVASGRPGVCVVGKGPAVANAVTGLVEARAAGAPVVLLAGGTAVDRRGSGAFQELDQVALVSSAVKWAHRVDHPDRVVPAVERAFLVATSGAPGPVYLELPDHLVGVPVRRDRPWTPFTSVERAVGVPVAGPALAALRSSGRPVLLVGGGMRHRNADGVVERFAEALGAAVFTTASGRGAVGEGHPLFCGVAGLYTPPGTESLWSGTDLVVAVGTRLEETATTGWDGLSAPVLQVDVDPASLSTAHGGPKVVGDGADVLAGWTPALGPRDDGGGWRALVARCREVARERAGAVLAAAREDDRLHVVELLAAIDEVVPADRVLVQENGLQDMWSYFHPHYSCHVPGGCVAPSEQTTLGFGSAAALGVRLAVPHRPVVAFVGDGAFTLFRPDLATADREGVAVLYVVLRNGGYGWLHAQLDRHRLDPARHPFAADAPTADGAGVHFTVTDKARLADVLRQAFEVTTRGGVAVVHADVDLADRHPSLEHLIGDFPAHVAHR
ncbi:thiamine pyrophosphate-binding protein [Actinosynnema sp. NPDC053489]|uniref:thiamine pyrophosphate-binding protein n=1 Tax=Actinosynnema sp. NPDC053489 TaxID=3363916 RepID=UPI0037C8D106